MNPATVGIRIGSIAFNKSRICVLSLSTQRRLSSFNFLLQQVRQRHLQGLSNLLREGHGRAAAARLDPADGDVVDAHPLRKSRPPELTPFARNRCPVLFPPSSAICRGRVGDVSTYVSFSRSRSHRARSARPRTGAAHSDCGRTPSASAKRGTGDVPKKQKDICAPPRACSLPAVPRGPRLKPPGPSTTLVRTRFRRRPCAVARRLCRAVRSARGDRRGSPRHAGGTRAGPASSGSWSGPGGGRTALRMFPTAG